ncbi:methyltransferase-like protein 27 [Asterias amurensis]|uniref:methyltransferase-like protein 27 n=1 Tax=Asterias amurensis TaxID=7602 RepID=UPI003AB38872
MATMPEDSGTVKDYHCYKKLIFSFPGGGKDLFKVYDDWADNYESDSTSHGYVAPTKLADIASDIIGDKSARILDAASGTGMIGAELKLRGFTCIDALDPSQRSLDKSKTRQAYTNYICDTLDDHKTEIQNDVYDAVLMCGSFGLCGHVTDSCFPELIRITKPGGFIMFTVSTQVLDEWQDRLDASFTSFTQQGLWQLVEKRWCQYGYYGTQKLQAIVPVLKIT